MYTKRHYIHDKDRAHEVDLAWKIIDSNCQNPGDEEAYQEVYKQWFNVQHCKAAEADLELVQDPNTRSTKDDIKKKRAQVKKYCDS